MLLDVYILYDQRETHWWRRGHPGLRRFPQCVFKRIGSVYFYEVENTVVGGGWRLSCTQWVLFGGLLKKIHIVTNWPNKSGINVQSRNIIYTYIYIMLHSRTLQCNIPILYRTQHHHNHRRRPNAHSHHAVGRRHSACAHTALVQI